MKIEEIKTYSFDCHCSNCGKTFEGHENFGIHRPNSYPCPYCGCDANTQVAKEKPRFYDYRLSEDDPRKHKFFCENYE